MSRSAIPYFAYAGPGRLIGLRNLLTADDPDVVAGKRDQLLGKLQEKYGLKREEAEKELDEFHRKF
jgi:hypothetical protein